MKKIFSVLVIFMISANLSVLASATDSVTAGAKQSVFSTVLETITGKIKTPSNPIAANMVNNVKLNAYKKQLELKQQELQEVDSSSAIFFVKWYKKYTINNKINEIQNQINELENHG